MRNRPRLLDLDPGLGTDNGLGWSRTGVGMVGWRAKSLLWTRLLQTEVSQEEGHPHLYQAVYWQDLGLAL